MIKTLSYEIFEDYVIIKLNTGRQVKYNKWVDPETKRIYINLDCGFYTDDGTKAYPAIDLE
jgi:hypothetical protein